MLKENQTDEHQVDPYRPEGGRGSGSDDSIEDKDALRRRDSNASIEAFARSFTNLSRQNTTASSLGPIPSNINPYIDTSDPRLDPFNPRFNARAWTRHVVNLNHKLVDNYSGCTAGVSFTNLGAYGYGTSSDYQKNFLNIVYSGVQKIASLGKKGSKIQILRNFDGLVKQGETCVVLGRPGR